MNKLREKGRDKGKKPANTADHSRRFMRSAVLAETVLYGIEGNGEALDYLMLPGHYAAITDYCDSFSELEATAAFAVRARALSINVKNRESRRGRL